MNGVRAQRSHADAWRPGGPRRDRRLAQVPPPRARTRPLAGGMPRDGYKRPFDLALLLLAGALFAPLWVPLAVAAATAIRVQDGGPVLYRQRRLGRGGAVFEILKFRTMVVGAERVSGPVWAMPHDRRATPVGRWLRRLRIDELPQGLNVLRGDMSLVGPRPERPEFAARCEREAPGFAQRLAVRPGIAGLAQARGGAAVPPRQKLRYDLLYIHAMGPGLDLKLCAASLLRAVREVLPRTAQRNPAAGGWLRYDDRRAHGEGLNHERRNLECLLAEAYALGRLAVPPPLRLTPRHNAGVTRDWRWETYFDLGASVLVDAAGRVRPLPLASTPPGTGAGAPVPVPAGAPVPAAAAVAVRYVTSPVWRREVPPDVRARARAELRPSARVLALARPVVAALADGRGGYAAVHVRRGDRLFGPMRWLTGPAQVRRRLRRLGVADHARVFLLTDEPDPAFRDALAAHYELLSWRDFPALAAVVAPGSPQHDNYLLYEAEKAVMRAAPVRLETFPGPEYELADAVLVPAGVWIPARLARRTTHAGLRLLRRCVGERGWRALHAGRRWLAAPGMRGPRRRRLSPGDAR